MEQNTDTTLQSFERTLVRYKEKLAKKPNSTFFKGLVKNTEEVIRDLKEESKKG
jgi:hypothetical protein